MVGVITIHVGRFYCLEFVNTLTLWQMLCLGRCYCHVLCVISLFEVDVLTSKLVYVWYKQV